jgi:Fe-S cluster assembly protein SufB
MTMTTPANNRATPRAGVDEALVREISAIKNEPAWMLEKRLRGFALFREAPLPTWGPDLAPLNLDEIVYFVRPGTPEADEWNEVPPEIRRTFEELGIPEAERRALSGTGAQYDSEIVYHRLKREWADLGVVFENMDVAVQKYPDLVRRYFMTDCVPVHDHKFVSLHAAVWSGGTFIYVPKGVRVNLPLQAYFRMNAERGGQFEHTLIIADEGASIEYIEGCSAPRYSANSLHAGCVELHVAAGATIRYTSVENWSKNTWNLNTKRAVVDAGGRIEWLGGNLGAGVTMLYPMSILRGDGATSEHVGAAFASEGQNQDTGAKVVLAAPNTAAVVKAKSVSRGGGVSTYRGLVRVTPAAKNARVSVQCDSLILDDRSVANAYPTLRSDAPDADVTHEASVGRISDEAMFYLMSRGLPEDEARRLIVAGFVEPVSRRLPLEYAVEFNKLITLEMKGAVG